VIIKIIKIYSIWTKGLFGLRWPPKGEKSINVTTFGSERRRISLILSICSNGEKPPPLVVSKGKKMVI